MRWALLLPLAATACDLSMTRQARHEAQGGASLWPGGPPAEGAPAGAIARDQPARDAAAVTPPHLTTALLERGQQRYRIFCAPCHAEDGGGAGAIVQRGFPRPRPFDDRDTPRQVVDAVTQGYGAMYPFSDRIDPADRWAIAAYVQALKRPGG